MELSATTGVAFNNEALGSLSHLQQLSTLELGFEGRWCHDLAWQLTYRGRIHVHA